MRMKVAILVSTILSIALIGFVPAVFAEHSVPLKGSMSGVGTATSPGVNSITATVHVPVLGKSTLVGATRVTGLSECGGFVGTEVDTITTANGDKVFLMGHGHSCVGSAPNIFEDTVTFRVTGGTGRFSDASGSGTTQTEITITSPTTLSSTFTAEITGSLTL